MPKETIIKKTKQTSLSDRNMLKDIKTVILISGKVLSGAQSQSLNFSFEVASVRKGTKWRTVKRTVLENNDETW